MLLKERNPNGTRISGGFSTELQSTIEYALQHLSMHSGQIAPDGSGISHDRDYMHNGQVSRRSNWTQRYRTAYFIGTGDNVLPILKRSSIGLLRCSWKRTFPSFSFRLESSNCQICVGYGSINGRIVNEYRQLDSWLSQNRSERDPTVR